MLTATREDLILLFLVFVSGIESKLFEYGLDNQELCKGRNILLQKIEDSDLIVLTGKTDRDNSPFRECTIKFSPSSKAKKRTTMIVFESYHIYDCGIYLAVQESPSEFFDKEVSKVFNLSCSSKPGKTPFYTKPDNFVLITLHKLDDKKLGYNFIFNISLTDEPPEMQFSTRILIGIGILIAIAVPGIACVIFKYLKVRRWSKQQEEREEEFTSQSLQPLRRFPISNSSESTNRYSSMPLAESSSTPTHTHTCIIDNVGPDGRCTVCHRRHENYAHVSVSPDNQVGGSANTSNTCHLCNRSHEDFAHFVEINGTTHVINDPVDTSSHSHRHRRSGEHSHHHHHNNHQNHDNRHHDSSNLLSVPGDETQSASEDDDLDVSGNDLIPPSYDLSPPSYDEAIHMPKPTLNSSTGNEESDPLYQNIDHSNVLTS